MNVRIVTDSTTDISQEQAAQLGISVVPLKTLFGEVEYHEGIDLFTDEFYPMLEAAVEIPTTSQPSPAAFERVYRPALDADESIVVITISQKLSGTFQSASIAAEACEGDITVIDSEVGCVAQQILVLRAIELRDAGKDARTIVETLEREKADLRFFAAFDTLEYLYKGGRLSRTSAMAGTLMKVKPIITLIEGELASIAKCRGSVKAYEEIFSRIDAEGGIDFSRPWAIGYTGDSEKFTRFEQMVRQRFGDSEPLKTSVGCAIGTHAGPGAVAIGYFRHTA